MKGGCRMLSEISRLDDRDLARLQDGLAQGTIRPGGGTAQIRRAGILEHAEMVDSWLEAALARFGSLPALQAAVGLVKGDRDRGGTGSPPAELILTGPATSGDPGRDTGVAVREVFESARHSVLIVGYAFFGGDRIFGPLAARMGRDPGLSTRIVMNIHHRAGEPPGGPTSTPSWSWRTRRRSTWARPTSRRRPSGGTSRPASA